MINGKSILAIIPARGASKGLPGKNLRILEGHSLLGWSILAARGSTLLDQVIVSSEDDAIIEEAIRYDCEVPFKRPKELALDTTPGIDPILHAINNMPPYDIVVLLQPTSPLRTSDDIDQCLHFFSEHNANACVSVVEEKINPYWMYTLTAKNTMTPFLTDRVIHRRQDLPLIYRLNGSIYVASIEWLKVHKTFFAEETLGFPMPLERSVDIDSYHDFLLAQAILNAEK